MLFSFKQKSQDFIVEEELPFKLSGKGDAFFVYFEKRNLTTMEIIEFLCKELNISRLTLGFAGLKDKDAITRQRVSIYKSALNKIGGENNFVNTLSKKTRIIKTSRHIKPIGMTSNINNRFHIRLRALKKLSEREIKNVENLISSLFNKGFPNVFGSQRFGIEGKNRKIGKDIVEGKTKIKEKFESKFKLQSYASRIFNEYVAFRTRKIELLDGDIVELEGNTLGYFDKNKNSINIIEKNTVSKDFFHYPKTTKESVKYSPNLKINITGPVIGYDLLCPPTNSRAGEIEKSFLEKHKINKDKLKIFSDNKIFGLRRCLWTYPQKAKYSRDGEDILIDFTLNSGTYASVFIEILLNNLGKINKPK